MQSTLVASPYVIGAIDKDKTNGRADFFATHDAKTGNPTPYLYKEYKTPKPEIRARILNFQQYVEGFHKRTGILYIVPALPHAAVQRTDDTKFGVLVQNVKRSRETKSLDVAMFKNLSLGSRLLIAASLARQVASLHNAHIIHTDINPPNILFHNMYCKPPIDLIDMDWAAVGVPGKSGVYRDGLAPETFVFFQSNFLAPEIRYGTVRPTIESDLWGLAMALHYILLTPREPFSLFKGVRPDDVTTHKLKWPPEPAAGETNSSKRHRAAFARLDVILMENFRLCFDRQYDKIFYPHLRPSAIDWMKDLDIAMKNMKVCSSCRESYVGMYGRKCPICKPEGKVKIIGGRRVPLRE